MNNAGFLVERDHGRARTGRLLGAREEIAGLA